MLSPDERLLIGLRVLERLKPSLRNRRMTPGRKPLPALEDEGPEEYFEAPGISGGAQSEIDLPSLEGLLEQTGLLASGAILLGACEDGLPFLVELDNPTPGSLLIAGDRGSGKTRLLKAILASAGLLNRPEEVSYAILAREPGEYLQASLAPNCEQILAPGAYAGSLIEDLCLIADQRRQGNSEGPALILAIDDLLACIHSLDADAFIQLYWLIRHGPRYRIWTIATLEAGRAGWLDERVLEAFRTRLIGRISDEALAGTLAGNPGCQAGELAAGYQFCVPFGAEWIRFWVCESQVA